MSSINLAMALEAPQWSLNDVSILFPLPNDLENSSLLKAYDSGLKGSLIPKEFFIHFPELDSRRTDNSQIYPELEVLAARLDPMLLQIRLVFQPLGWNALEIEKGPIALDQAIHVTYQLSSPEFQIFISNYQDLILKNKVKLQGIPLTTHPVLASEKMKGPFSQGLKNLLLASVGHKNIARITFMQLISNGGVWGFSGVDVKDGKLKKLIIPRTKSTEQEFTNVSVSRYSAGEVLPAPKGADTFNSILQDLINAKSDLKVVRKEVASAFKVENPRVHTTESVDCVSCHTANGARDFALKLFSKDINRSEFSEYPSPYQASERATNNLRVFGYFNHEPSISQRVINESAEVVLELQK